MDEIILNLVNENPGIKAIELVSQAVVSWFVDNEGNGKEIPDAVEVLNLLVEDGRLVEIEYILPDSDYRIRSIYFPSKTSIKLGCIWNPQNIGSV